MKYGFTCMRMLPEWTGTFIDEFTFSPLQLFRALSLVPSRPPFTIKLILLKYNSNSGFQIHKVWIKST